MTLNSAWPVRAPKNRPYYRIVLADVRARVTLHRALGS